MKSDRPIPLGPLERVGPTPTHIGHKNHLCDIVAKGDVTVEGMKALIRDPKFICATCGRVSATPSNLCEPVTLDYTCGMCGASFKTAKGLRNHARAPSHGFP